MKVNRGDIVLIDHPFSDASGSKVRPALIVQNDRRNALLTETIVALITKNVAYVATDPTQVLIDIATPDGKSSGLRISSAVKSGKLYTVHEKMVIRKLGILSSALLQQVNNCLKVALELP